MLRSVQIRSGVALTFGLAALVALGCSRGALREPGRPTTDAQGASNATSKTSSAAPAVWVNFGQLGGDPILDVQLSSAARLVMTRSGTRWILGTEGQAEGPFGSPEPMRGGVVGSGELIALAASGRTYRAAQASAPLLLATDIEDPFVDSALGGTASSPVFLGIQKDGRARTSRDFGRSWTDLESDRFFVAAWADRDGHFVLESLPEAQYLFRGEGPLEPLVGSTRSTSSATAQAGSFIPGDARRFARATDFERLGALDAPSDRVLIFEPERGGGFAAFEGQLGRPLIRRPSQLPIECEPQEVAVSASVEAVLCRLKDTPGRSIDVFIRPVTSPRFSKRLTMTVSEGARPTIRTSPSGTFAMTGVCGPSDSEPGCEGQGLYVFDSGSGPLAPVPIPLLGRPLAFGFAADNALFSVYQRVADDHVLVYRYAASAPSRSDAPNESRLSSLDLTKILGLRAEVDSQATLLPGSGATTGLVLTLGSRRVALALDPRLRPTGLGSLPEGTAVVGGAGENVVAVDPRGRRAWESKNAGLSFEPFEFPRLPAEAQTVALICSRSGCLWGSEALRLGWGTLKSKAKTNEASTNTLVLARCAINDVEAVRLNSAPTAYDAARGDVAWSELKVDMARAEVSVVHAPYGRLGLEVHELLPASLEPEQSALFVSQQIEGSGALRYRIPSSEKAPIESVEVAWDNRFDGTVRREQMRLSGEEAARLFRLQSGDYERSGEGARRASPWFFSISPGVVYFGLHARGNFQDGVFVVGDSPGGRVAPIPKVLQQSSGAQFEMIRDGDADVSFMTSESALLLRVARENGAARQFRLGPPPSEFVVASAGIGYTGVTPEFYARMDGVAGDFSRAYRVSVHDLVGGLDGVPSRAVPTLFDIVGRPRPCRVEDRSRTARSVLPVPTRLGWQLEVEVLQGVYLTFDAVRAVLFGTLQDPCVAILEAEPHLPLPPGVASYPHRVLVDLNSDAPSWRFSLRPTRLAEESVSVTTLRCASGSGSPEEQLQGSPQN
jgi:hypothetical protein